MAGAVDLITALSEFGLPGLALIGLGWLGVELRSLLKKTDQHVLDCASDKQKIHDRLDALDVRLGEGDTRMTRIETRLDRIERALPRRWRRHH